MNWQPVTTLTLEMLAGDLPEQLIDAPIHVVVEGEGLIKYVKVASYEKFAELWNDAEASLANSRVIVYALPYLSLADACSLGVSMGDLVCNEVKYTLGNEPTVNKKIKMHMSIEGKKMTADNLLNEIKDIRPKPKVRDLDWFEQSRRHAWARYITSLMRNGTDEFVQNAVKAFSSQLYQDIYGGPFGFDQQKFDNLRMKYTQEYEDATNPEVEMKSVLSAQGILSEKTDQEDSRGDLVSLIRSFKLQISSICEEMYQLTTKLSLVGNGQGVI